MCVAINRISKCTKQKLKEENNKYAITIGYFNMSPSLTNRTNKQKINTESLYNISKELDLTDIYRTLHTTEEYALISGAHGAFKK